MKTSILYMFIFALSGIGIKATAQNKVSQVYNRFEDTQNVYSFTFNKDLRDVLDSQFDWGNSKKEMTGDLKKVKTLVVGNGANSRKVLEEIHEMLRSLNLTVIELPNKDAENNMFIYALGKNGRYSEIHNLVIGDDRKSGILISVYGDIKIKDKK